ncbi:MAG: hypothetical protein ACOCM8_06900 [Acetivibrio ethanolgignens]
MILKLWRLGVNNRKFKIRIAVVVIILLAFYTYWLKDTKIKIPEENVMFIIYETQSNREITDSDVKRDIIEIIEGFKVRRNVFGEYLPVGGFAKKDGNILITIMDYNKPERYEVYIRTNGKSFLNIPGKGKFIIEDKKVLVDYLERSLK